VMLLKKTKTASEYLQLQIALSRLGGIKECILRGGEPLLSMKLSALVRELEIVLEDSDSIKGDK